MSASFSMASKRHLKDILSFKLILARNIGYAYLEGVSYLRISFPEMSEDALGRTDEIRTASRFEQPAQR